MRRAYNIGIVSAFLLGVFNLYTVQGQAIVRLLDNTDNMFVFEIEGTENHLNPDQIILVYDSSVVSYKKTNQFASIDKMEEYANREYVFETNRLKSLLAVEIESEMAVADWMLSPFKVNRLPDFLEPVEEEEITLEPWMTDLSQWN